MEIHQSQHELRPQGGLPLHCDLFLGEKVAPRGVVVFVHGFKGFKDWGFFPYSARWMAERGWAAVTFDFSLNGVGTRAGIFDRLDLFEENTYTREIEDLQEVLRWIRRESPMAATLRGAEVGLVAHSRGNLPAVVTAVEDDSISALVSWNGVARALRASPRQLEEWERQGRLEFINARTGQRMAVGAGLLKDAREQAARYDLASRLRESSLWHLILQAEKDLAVDPAEADLLCMDREENPHCRRIWIKGTGHTWGAVHPFKGTTPALESVLELTEEWFAAHLES